MKRRPAAKRSADDFLLEIGCEEIPADYLPAVLDWDEGAQGLGFSAMSVLGQKGIASQQIQSFATLRRMVLLVQGMEAVVRKREKGPPVHVAFDPQGQPTRAAQAFAQRHRLKVSQLVRQQTPKGELVFAEYDVPVGEILREAVPEIIQAIRFPKVMRWDESGARFARPIRWLLALYGSAVLPSSFGLVQSHGFTRGPRAMGEKSIRVPNPSAYFSVLRRMKMELEKGRIWKVPGEGKTIPVRPTKRENLRQQLAQAAQRCGGRLPDETTEEFAWLLDTMAFLSEQPVVQAGSFEKIYLDLPSEVLATSMAKHLKLLSIRAKGSEDLLPKFLAVLEGKPNRPAMVMANIERILEARFTDARFFYEADTRSPFQSNVPVLGKIVFHEKLGTVEERIPRLAQLMKEVARQVPLPPDAVQAIPRAALLCKADLVSQMVRELPSLQGIMGGHYAKGEPELVVRAISEQYRPRTAADPLPQTALGAVLSLADRMDTLIGYFGVGLRPTGSADPYGLRRQALGLTRILITPPHGISFVGLSIDRLCDEGIQSWDSKLSGSADSLKRELRAFLRERFEWLVLRDSAVRQEFVAAVCAANDDDLASAHERLVILRDLWAHSKKRVGLLRAAKVAERAKRIVEGSREKGKYQPAEGPADPSLLKEPAEKQLWASWSKAAPLISELVSHRQYDKAVETYGTLYQDVHQFFETVFVMDENQDLKWNRIRLMGQIYKSLASRFADLSKLPLGREELRG